MITVNFWTFIFNIINVFVLFLLLKKFLFGPVTAMMEKRKASIETSFADIENKNNEASKLKQEYEEALENAGEQVISIIKDAKQRALEEHDKQIKVAKEEVLKIMADANKSIETQRKLSIQNIQSEIAGIAILAASKIIQKNVDNSSNKQIINDFLAEAGAGK